MYHRLIRSPYKTATSGNQASESMRALPNDCWSEALDQLLPLGNPTAHPKCFVAGFLDVWLADTFAAISRLQRLCIQCVCRNFAAWHRRRRKKFRFSRRAPGSSSPNFGLWYGQTWIVYRFALGKSWVHLYFEELGPFLRCGVGSDLYRALLGTQLRCALPGQNGLAACPRSSLVEMDVRDAVQSTELRAELAAVVAASPCVELCRRSDGKVALFPATYRYTCCCKCPHGRRVRHLDMLRTANVSLLIKATLSDLNSWLERSGWTEEQEMGSAALTLHYRKLCNAALRLHPVTRALCSDSIDPRAAKKIATHFVAACEQKYRVPLGIFARQTASRQLRAAQN